RFFFVSRETVFGAHLFAQLLVLNFLPPRVFVQSDPVLIQLMTKPLHVHHHVMEFRIVLHSFGRTASYFINERRTRPLGIPGLWRKCSCRRRSPRGRNPAALPQKSHWPTRFAGWSERSAVRGRRCRDPDRSK